ncbi:hypothetical protein ILYODFUR_003149 [Ilyodon furcidens]|uniref:Uncharacterized protein n=1 Tax=Ilyodon furcidens TaxID=33524 RepID=A0ABV0UCY7_9TELE
MFIVDSSLDKAIEVSSVATCYLCHLFSSQIVILAQHFSVWLFLSQMNPLIKTLLPLMLYFFFTTGNPAGPVFFLLSSCPLNSKVVVADDCSSGYPSLTGSLLFQFPHMGVSCALYNLFVICWHNKRHLTVLKYN